MLINEFHLENLCRHGRKNIKADHKETVGQKGGYGLHIGYLVEGR
jgi:hypothetical protein